jgi:phospholipase/carboxylesterase
LELLYTAHVPGGDGPFPTIIALHGFGASAHDLIGLAPILHGGRAIVLCPQGPAAVEIGPQMPPGYAWFPMTGGRPPDRTAVGMAQGLIEIFIDDACQRYPVDPKKLVLAGFSQGGLMASLIALSDPARYAGLLAMSTWLPDEIASSIDAHPAHEMLPTLVLHGTEDPMIPIDRAYASRDALLRMKVPVAFREYPMGHEIKPEALRDILGWLEEKVISPVELA